MIQSGEDSMEGGVLMITQPISQTPVHTCPACGQTLTVNPTPIGTLPWMGQPTYQPMPYSPQPTFGWPGASFVSYPQPVFPAAFSGPTPGQQMLTPGYGSYPQPWLGQWYGPRPPVAYTGYTGGIPNDNQIEELVWDAIDNDPLIPYDANINVKVEAGTVTLAGEVPNKHAKLSAEHDAFWVPGVLDVNNGIKVLGHRRRTQTQRGK